MDWNAEKIKVLRERTGLSQAAIARRLGISLWTWHRWEHGKHRPTGVYRRILDDLAVEVFSALS